MKNYEASGQNDPDNFAHFIPRTPSTRELSSAGKRCIVLFVAMKCGTPEEDQDALELTKKDAAPGMGWDEGNVGIGRQVSGSTLNRRSRRKRRRAGLIEDDNDTRENVSELVAAVTTLASSMLQRRRGEELNDPASMSYPQLVTTRGHLIEKLTSIDSKMKEARPNLHAILQNQFDSIAKALDRLPQCEYFAD